MKKLRFECTRCGNCCTDKNTLVNLTYLDILKIKNGLNLEIDEILDIIGFFVFEKKFDDEDKKRMVIAPIETEKGLAFIALLKNSLGGCYFYNLEKKKCLIYNLRPIFCQTFPFSFDILEENKNQNDYLLNIFYTQKGQQYCPGINNKAPLIDKDYWIELGKRTLQDLEKNHKFIQEWNESIRKGEFEPTAKKFIYWIFELNDDY